MDAPGDATEIPQAEVFQLGPARQRARPRRRAFWRRADQGLACPERSDKSPVERRGIDVRRQLPETLEKLLHGCARHQMARSLEPGAALVQQKLGRKGENVCCQPNLFAQVELA